MNATPCSPGLRLIPSHTLQYVLLLVFMQAKELVANFITTFSPPFSASQQRDPFHTRASAVPGGEGRPCCPRSHAEGRGW